MSEHGDADGKFEGLLSINHLAITGEHFAQKLDSVKRL